MSATYVTAAVVQCIGKRTYRSKHDAKRAARRAETSFGGGKLDAYRCPHCAWFHVGHPPKRR